MKRHWPYAVLSVSGAIVLAVVLAWVFRPHEPVYQGKLLSYWVDQLYGGYRAPMEAADAAIRAMGPRTTQFLLDRVHRENSQFRRLWREIWRSQWLPTFVKRIIPAPNPRSNNLPEKTAHSLRLLGPAVVPYLVRALKDRDQAVRRIALLCIGIGGDRDEVVHAIIDRLHDPDPEIRYLAVHAVDNCGAKRPLAIPALIGLLSDHKIAANSWSYMDMRVEAPRALGRIGPQAAGAVPELTRLMGDASPPVRQAAATSLWKINGDKTVIPFLIGELEKSQDAGICAHILMDLGDIGPAARVAVPAISRRIDRSAGLQNPTLNDTRTFALQALGRIDPDTAIVIRMQDLSTALLNKDPQDYVRCREVLSGLAQMGVAAKPALNTLLEVAKGPGGTWPDYERTHIAQAAIEAVQKIDPEATERLKSPSR